MIMFIFICFGFGGKSTETGIGALIMFSSRKKNLSLIVLVKEWKRGCWKQRSITSKKQNTHNWIGRVRFTAHALYLAISEFLGNNFAVVVYISVLPITSW